MDLRLLEGQQSGELLAVTVEGSNPVPRLQVDQTVQLETYGLPQAPSISVLTFEGDTLLLHDHAGDYGSQSSPVPSRAQFRADA